MEKPAAEHPGKAACREAAEDLATEEGLCRARRLQRAGLLRCGEGSGEGAAEGGGEGVREGPEGGADGEAPRPISIWRPGTEGGETVWVRPPPGPFGDHYAARETLRPRRPGGPRRIAFFGESAAAGYLYAPDLTPAGVLEARLAAAAGAGAWEVIDLARTDETLGSLAATIEASLQLEPDLLVVFAGNNWNLLETPGVSPYPPSVRGRQRYAEAVREGGLAGPVAEARRELGRAAGRALTRIAAAARSRGLPVVLVLPEVNLADWESRQPVAWLPGDGVARWYGLYGRARGALQRGDFEATADAAWAMVDLDGETCPTPCRLLAAAYRGRGDEARARAAAVAEVDAGSYALLCLLGAPQATTTARDLLRLGAERFGFETVDLRTVFAERGASLLPGSRFFLDYCHLTAEGMDAAMTAVADRVLGLTGPEAAPAGGPGRAFAISAEADATAKLGAAVHTAHRLVAHGSKVPRLAHWLGEALAASPGVREAMLDLVAARAAPCPAVLAAAQGRNAASPYPLSLQHGWRWDHLDADLLEAILALLAERGDAAGEEALAELIARRGVDGGGVDLVHPPYYLAEPLERFYPEVMRFADLPGRGLLRCPWPVTGFALVATGSRDLAAEVTLRLPAIDGAEGRRRGRVEVAVNGRRVGAAEAGEAWSRRRFHLPRTVVRRGLNRLTLAWPMPPPIGEAALEAALRRLELGREADLHPVFGEVFSLRVSAA